MSRSNTLARGQGYSLFLTPGAAVLGLRSEGAGKPTEWLRLVLQGAATAPAITGEEPLAGRSNYFVGNDPAAVADEYPHFCPGPLPAGVSRRGFDLLRPARTAGK